MREENLYAMKVKIVVKKYIAPSDIAQCRAPGCGWEDEERGKKKALRCRAHAKKKGHFVTREISVVTTYECT